MSSPTSKTPPSSHFTPLDAEEAALLKSLEQDEWKPLPPKKAKEEMTKLQRAAKATSDKSPPTSIRFETTVLSELKARAAESGIPWQNIVQALAKQYTKGKIKLEV